VLHLAFVLNHALGSPRCFQGYRRFSDNRFPLAKASVFRLAKSERHEVAVIAARGIRELHRPIAQRQRKYHLTVLEAHQANAGRRAARTFECAALCSLAHLLPIAGPMVLGIEGHSGC
jgi:hypothetical protein